MTNTFIHPNWHVIFIHYPIALLTAGVIVELITLVWNREKFRAAGRWMILLGALMSAVTLNAGIYAYRDVVSAVPTEPDYTWSHIVSQSPWNADQWRLMTNHIWFNAGAVAIFLIVVALWLSGHEPWRKRFYPALLVLLLVGVGLMSTGAWYAGEAIYRHGTGVVFDALKAAPPAALKAQGAGTTLEEHHQHPGAVTEEGTAHTEEAGGLYYYIPPLQLHITVAGLVTALAIAALGMSLRRWERAMEAAERQDVAQTPSGSPIINPPPTPRSGPTAVASAPTPGAEIPEPKVLVSPALLWLIALLVALGTAVAGLWSVAGAFASQSLKEALTMLGEVDHRRLLMHVITGVTLIVMALALAVVTKFFHRQYRLTAVLIVILMVMAALQVWTGVLMLYDSHQGPLTGFSASAEGKPPSTAAPTTQSAAPSLSNVTGAWTLVWPAP